MTYWRQLGVPLAGRAWLFAAGLAGLLAAAAPSPAQYVVQLQPNQAPAQTRVLELDKTPLPDALIGRRYAQTFPVDGGLPPYKFSFSGRLPDGMKAIVTPNTVLIEGVPQAMGDYPLGVSITDAMGQSQAGNYVLHVTPAATNAPVSIMVSESLKAADNSGNGSSGIVFSVLEAIKTADSITITLNGAIAGGSNAVSLLEAIKTADKITITLNGATAGGSAVSVPESIKARDTITLTLNGAATGGSGVSVAEAIRAADTITITLNGGSTGGSGVSAAEAIKTADTITITLNGGATGGSSALSAAEAIKAKDTITITLNGATAGGSGVSFAEGIKAKDNITITLNGATAGGSGVSVAEGIKAKDNITITLNGATAGGSGVSLAEAIMAKDTITITLNGATAGGSGVSVAEGIKAKDNITITLNGATVGGSRVSVAEGIKAKDTVTVTLNGQSTAPLAIVPTTLPDAVYNSAYSQSFTPSGGTGAAVTFGHSGALPAGLSFSGGTGSLTISGTPSATGSFPLTLTASDGTNNATLNVTVVVDQATQSINLGTLPTPTYGGAPFSVSATATSGLPVTITYVSGPATGSGSGPYTATGGGVVNFTATQAGNGNYSAAAPMNFSVNIAQATQSINLGTLPTPTYGGSPFSVSATATSGLPVTITYVSGPATGSGSGPYTATGGGVVNFTATQAGNGNYAAAAPVNFSVNIAQASQTINLGTLPTPTYGGSPFSVGATATSGLPVTITYVSGPATGSGSGPYTATGGGVVNFTATQAGNSNYAAAAPVNFSVNIAQASQTINLGTLPTPTYGGSPFSVSATATSGLPVTITYVSGPATGSGSGPYTATGGGTVNFTATQAGNGNYAAAAPVNFSVNVAQASQTINLGTLPTPTYGGSPFSVSATATSGLPVTITYVSGPATGSGSGPYTATGAGTVNFTATQAGNSNYSAAAPVNFSVNIAQASQTINLGTLPTPTYGGSPFSLSATATSGLPVTITYVSGPATGSGPYSTTGAGMVNFTATQTGNASYLAATPVNFSVNVGKQGSVTAVGASPTSITPVQTTTLTATVSAAVTGAPSGTVTFFDNGGPIGSPAAVTGGQAQLTTLLLSGAHAISATYSGDGNFVGSSSATSTTVSVAPLDFTMTPLSPVSLNVVPGSSAVVSFNMTPLYLIYPGPVTFSVTGLPSSATYTVTPTNVAATGGPQTVTVTIQTAAATVRNSMPSRGVPIKLAVFVPLLALGALRRRKRWPSVLVLVLSGFVGSAIVGCGSGTTGNGFFGQAPKTYPVVITATSGTVQHTINVTLVVQ